MFYKNPFFKYTLLAGLGSLMTLSYPPFSTIPICAIVFAIAFLYINNSVKPFSSFKEMFVLGGFFGLFSTSWITNSLLINGSSRFGIAAMGIYFGMFLFFGIFFACPTYLAVKLRPKGIQRLLLFSALFVIFEWIRSWVATGFPWNLLGNIWTPVLPILQITHIIGIYGLSLLTVYVFCSIALIPKIKPLFLGLVCLGGVYCYGYWRLYTLEEKDVLGVRIRVVQPTIPQTYKWDDTKEDENLDKLIRLSNKNNSDITHVIWPETAVSFLIELDEIRRGRFISAVPQGGTLITGGLRLIPTRNNLPYTPKSNSVFVINGDTAKIIDFYDKKHLVPFGEYIPAPFKKLPFLKTIVSVPPSDLYVDKDTPKKNTFIPKTPKASVLICYEAIFSGKVSPSNERPGWLVVVSNDAWYGISHGPYQHFSMAQIRAVEEGLPLFRSSNNGISAAIDPYGRILAQLPLGSSGFLDAPLPVALPQTLYSKYGIKIPLSLCFLMISLSFLKKREKN